MRQWAQSMGTGFISRRFELRRRLLGERGRLLWTESRWPEELDAAAARCRGKPIVGRFAGVSPAHGYSLPVGAFEAPMAASRLAIG